MSWLSFITPLTLYRGRSARNTLIEVREVYGKRKLYLDRYPQTNPGYRRDWYRIFQRSRVFDWPARGQALLLGLGGGDVIQILTKLRPQWRVTAVELDREVIGVAKQYFGVGETKKRSVVEADARAYISANRTKYDLIIVDLYSGDDIPEFVNADVFLRGVARSLTPTGRAIFNYASHSFGKKDFRLFEVALQRVFTYVTMLKTWGHTFYLAYDSKN